MNANPFGIPDFSALGGASANPLLRSMDMMAQAWKNMASGGAAELGPGMMPSLSAEDLDRRIRDLRAVESWLQLNLSMLGTTIQGLEIQRSTLAALKTMSQQGGLSAGQNPFEALMAMNPLAAAPPAAPPAAQAEAPAQQPAEPADSPEPAAGPGAQAWWTMLQQQFDAMAAATAASLRQVDALRQQAGQAMEQVQKTAADSSAAAPAKTVRKTARRSSAAARTAPESAGKKT
ncbi:PhaM family polyhydroxyalkanoate granule multifunctional regulatory protein [Alcaligenes sp. WGS1538]|uniref:PhaM family polyhydroxyalkanoate granule multifunctional regulatory protein n=1 Tax=Alcaligenes sp. WGS1538 TaxID=3366811 RepID=UPI00372D1021